MKPVVFKMTLQVRLKIVLTTIAFIMLIFVVTVSKPVLAGTVVPDSWKISGSYPSNTYSMNGVSCIVATTFCVVVGDGQISNVLQPEFGVIAVSNTSGTNWTQQTLPTGVVSLNGISCTSTSFCVAVGNGASSTGVVLISTSYGTNWTQQTLPAGVVLLNGISCTSTSFCVAVGVGSGNTPTILVSDTNGTSWTQEPVPAGVNVLNGVSCSTTALCVAVGGYVSNVGYTISGVAIYSTDGGSSWNLGTFPTSEAYLSSTSCYSNSYCIAVGQNTILSSSNGSIWNQVQVPTGTYNLNNVICASSANCISTGGDSVLYTSNGSNWSAGSFPSGAFLVNGVSCMSATDCIAVGVNSNGNSTLSFETLSGGSTWSDNSLLFTVQNLNSVMCVSTSFCVAVGQTTSGDAASVISTNSGSSWSSATLPSNLANLNSVMCVSTSFCVAVGQGNSSMPGTYILLTVPTISALTPNIGITSGGTSVTIFGTNLSSTVSVYFGNVAANAFTVISNSEVQTTSPSVASAGVVAVTVVTDSGTSQQTSADEFVYLSPGYYHPINPVRICDTRMINTPYVQSNECDASGPQTLGPGSILNIPIVGQASIPSSAIAVVANITVTDTTANGGYLTLFPGLESVIPNSSNLNWDQGQTVANLVTVPIGPDGAIQAYNFIGQADVIVDVAGYYGPNSSVGSTAGQYYPITPFRICDTRQVGVGVSPNQCNNSTSNNPIPPNQTINIQMEGVGSIPSSGVSSVAVNITAIDPTTSGGGFLTAFPTGTTLPNVSNLNFNTGQTVPNRAILKLSTTGSISVYNFNGYTNLAVDVVGFYTAGSGSSVGSLFVPVSPVRICDTRVIDQPLVESNQCNLSGPQTLSSGSVENVQVSGVDSIPTNISAVVANVTVTDTDANGGYLTIYPSTNTLPNISDLNWNSGVTIANNCIITLSSLGTFSAYNYTGTADIIVDVNGYFVE